MFYDDPISGNASCGANIANLPRLRKFKDVEVNTQEEDGIVVPTVIIFDNKQYIVSKVIGCRRDPALNNAVEYGIKIGKYRTKIWRRTDGSWFVEPR